MEHTNEEAVTLLITETAAEAESAEETAEVHDAKHGAAQGVAPEAADPRMAELDRRIRDLEAAIGDLRTVTAAAAAREDHSAGRRTVGHPQQWMAKHGETVRPDSVDAALRGLSPEQRMFVKSGLLRAGLL